MRTFSEERFWSRMAPTEDGCWEWQGCTQWNGYGQIRINTKSERVHRVAWRLVNGEIPKGMWVLHKCDNRPCCNPEHLFIGTRSDNMRDCRDKGRLVLPDLRGESLAASKLTEDDVRFARKAYRSGEMNQTEIARHLGVDHTNIHHIVHRKTWKHVE